MQHEYPHQQFTKEEDMLCTMKVWREIDASRRPSTLAKLPRVQRTPSIERSSQASKKANGEHQGPELVLTPMSRPHIHGIHGCNSGELGTPIQMSERFASFGSGERTRRFVQEEASKGRTLGETSIQVSEIMVVDMNGEGGSHCTKITTMSSGLFEFTMDSQNGQEILLAFLKTYLPEERIMEGSIPRVNSTISQSTFSTMNRSFDAEAMTASRMKEVMRQETYSEKLMRQMQQIISNFDEITAALSDQACSWTSLAAVSPAPLEKEKRDSPPRENPFGYDRVEMAPETPVGKRSQFDFNLDAPGERRKTLELPSGLGVEYDEPEMNAI